jgi:hypothetical protein
MSANMPFKQPDAVAVRSWRRSFCPAIRTPQPPAQCCFKPDRPPLKPDPAIYSQEQRFALGQAVTWDSPDITTNLAGGIDENVVVTVRNLSSDSGAAAVNVRVDFSSLGIGLPRKTLGFKQVDLARAGMPGAEATIQFFVPPYERDDESRLAVFVELQHGTDRDQSNNQGEQAWSASGVAAGGPAAFSFPLANRLPGTQTFSLVVLESDWGAALNVGSVTLLPMQSVNVTLSVNVPSSFSGSKAFNIVARRSDGALYGGIFHRFDV